MLSKVDRIREYLYIDDKEEIFNSKQNEYIDKYVYDTFKEIDNYGKRILMMQILYGIIKFESKELIKDYEDNGLKCETLNGNIQLLLPENTGMKIDGISKRGKIFSDIEGLSIKEKPGNVQNITGILGEKPFQNVRISTINGDISLK